MSQDIDQWLISEKIFLFLHINFSHQTVSDLITPWKHTNKNTWKIFCGQNSTLFLPRWIYCVTVNLNFQEIGQWEKLESDFQKSQKWLSKNLKNPVWPPNRQIIKFSSKCNFDSFTYLNRTIKWFDWKIRAKQTILQKTFFNIISKKNKFVVDLSN